MVLFIMLHKVDLTFKSVHETLVRDLLIESYWAVLSWLSVFRLSKWFSLFSWRIGLHSFLIDRTLEIKLLAKLQTGNLWLAAFTINFTGSVKRLCWSPEIQTLNKPLKLYTHQTYVPDLTMDGCILFLLFVEKFYCSQFSRVELNY